MRNKNKLINGTAVLNIVLVIVGIILIIGALMSWGKCRMDTSELIGGQKDNHGCLIGAGYSWCDAKQDCIRQWETYCTKTTGKTVIFKCDTAKNITATFYIGDDKFVDLSLSDGRKMSVPHAISASGARYAKDEESFVFWNKGDTAFITENGTTTYSGCVTSTQ